VDNEQEIKVILRSIGHEFLLQLDDSTSRILPIEKEGDRYAIHFEKEFSFDPDLLILSTNTIIARQAIQDTYIVEVERCDTAGVIHSFKASLNEEDQLGVCKLRTLPKECYVFFFTIVEGPDKFIEEITTDSQTADDNKMNWKLIIGIIGLTILVFVVYLIRKSKKPKVTSEVVTIGKFQFDKKGMTLTMKAQSIELSSKETELLLLLVSNENKTLERELILKVVWGDEGGYVGRTLDVFISKLRKKLEADPSLKIINVRGVGYRFVVN
jgi:hypothetical protein